MDDASDGDQEVAKTLTVTLEPDALRALRVICKHERRTRRSAVEVAVLAYAAGLGEGRG